MKFNTKNQEELNAALEYLSKLVGTEATIEIKRYSPKRTNQQNRYYWLLLHAFSQETGYEVGEAEQIFKEVVNPELFVYEKNGIPFTASSTSLSTKDMATCIDRFHRYSAEAGFPLPQAYDEAQMIALENRYEA